MPPFQFRSKSFPIKKSKIYEIPDEVIETGEFSFGVIRAASIASNNAEPNYQGSAHGFGEKGGITYLSYWDKKDYIRSRPYFDLIIKSAIDYALLGHDKAQTAIPQNY